MDLNEFSVACKLITNQLKGFPLPQTLPPQMKVGAGAAAPMTSMGMAMPPVSAPVPSVMPVHSMASPMPVHSMASPMPGMPTMQPGMMQPGMQPMMQPGMMQPGMHPGMQPGMQPPVSMGMMPGQQPGMMPGQMMPGQMPMPQQQPADSWAVPVMTRQKYQAQFVNTDRNRTGFLAGAQARNLLLQTGLAQNILAQIWGLSDVDADGRLSTEEFILAGHFCDLAMKGEPLPPAGEVYLSLFYFKK